MHISVDDLNFLIELENELGERENWSNRVERLWRLNEKLLQQREEGNKRVRDMVREKRKADKNYARTKK